VIGQETLDRVRRDVGIVELIGETVKLQKRGRSYVGLCPFHKEKSPSFHVSPERGFYHCFGCHESGDAIKFVQRMEGLDFVEAVRRLAERMGIEIVETVNDAERKQQAELRRRRQELYEIGNVAASYFERMLREHPLAHFARAELERRALVPSSPTDSIADALQAFRVGYAPYGWDGLARHLREAGMSLSAAEKVGLLAPRKTGQGYYDRFRHRLMFAVLDVQGRVIAFSGRALEDPPVERLRALGLDPPSNPGEPPAKYVNSPESPIYKKREAVFGLYQARQAIHAAERTVIVEGNFDVLSLHARGIKNVVAPLGTAFTTEQAQQIKRFAGKVTLLFDGDSAGRRAVKAAQEPCRAAGLVAHVATLPSGVDPDEFVRQNGAEALERLLKAAQGMLEYLIDVTLDAEFPRYDAVAAAAVIKEVETLLAGEDDPTVRALAEQHADRLAARLNVADARTFLALANKVRAAAARGAAAGRGAQAPSGAASPTGTGAAPARFVPASGRPGFRVQPPSRARSRDRRADLSLVILGALLDFPELFDSPETLQAANLLEGDSAIAFVALRHAWNSAGFADPEQVLAKLPASIHPFARARLAAPVHERLEDAAKELAGSLMQLEKQEYAREKSFVTEELRQSEKTGDFEQQALLLQQLFDKAAQRAVKKHTQ
jgi:DNA primase